MSSAKCWPRRLKVAAHAQLETALPRIAIAAVARTQGDRFALARRSLVEHVDDAQVERQTIYRCEATGRNAPGRIEVEVRLRRYPRRALDLHPQIVCTRKR